MNYRDILYGTDVSNNKYLLRKKLANPDGQDIRNLTNLHRAMAIWLNQVPRHGKVLDVACGLWSMIRQMIKGIHVIETGGPSTQIYTRVMRATAVKAN